MSELQKSPELFFSVQHVERQIASLENDLETQKANLAKTVGLISYLKSIRDRFIFIEEPKIKELK